LGFALSRGGPLVTVAGASAQPSGADILVDVEGAVATITLLDDARMNALRRSAWVAIREALSGLEADPKVRVILMTGDGDRAFSAGGDIHGYESLADALLRREFIVDCMRTFEALQTCCKPVIAVVNGVAMGGGFELALACDIVLAASTAVFALPEARLGLIPGFGISRLCDVVSPGWARYLVFSGERIDAEQAQRIGLVQQVHPLDELRGAARALAERIAESAPLALAAGKNLIANVQGGRSNAAIDAVVMLQASEDASEGIVAFKERRPARFTGR
jgi:enoyl-CoA hydratase